MRQLVLLPMRGDRILDVIMTTAPAPHAGCRIEPPITTSVHCIIVCNISAPPRVKHLASVNALDFRRADFALINQLLYVVDWVGLSSQYNENNSLWSCIANAISHVIQSPVPLVERRASYVSSKHQALFLRKKRRWKKYKGRPTQQNKDAYKKATRQLAAAIISHRSKEESTLLSKSPQAFYAYVSRRYHPSA
jgi:hypothetical protein